MTHSSGVAAAHAIEDLHRATAIYTQQGVVDDLLDIIDWPHGGGQLLDPSAGDGIVLRRALVRLAPAPGDRSDLARLAGWEIYPPAADEAREGLAAGLVELGWSRSVACAAVKDVVRVGDFLTAPSVRAADAIVGNPPYLRLARLPDHFKSLYRSRLAARELPDLLYAFLGRCARVLAPGGTIAMVTADRWLLNANAGPLREQLGRRLSLAHVDRLDVASAYYRPKSRRAGTLPRVHPVRVVLREGSDSAAAALSAAPHRFGIGDAAGPVLADVASVRLAPWLGPHGIFVLDETEAAQLTGAETVPAVDTDDIDGDILGRPWRRAILTHRDVEPAPSVRAHLARHIHRMPARGQRRAASWLPPEAISLDLTRPSILVPRIARTIRAIALPAGVLPINHNLSIVAADAIDLDMVRSTLLHARSQEWVRDNALRLENGFLSITTSLLRRLPVPEFRS